MRHLSGSTIKPQSCEEELRTWRWLADQTKADWWNIGIWSHAPMSITRRWKTAVCVQHRPEYQNPNNYPLHHLIVLDGWEKKAAPYSPWTRIPLAEGIAKIHPLHRWEERQRNKRGGKEGGEQREGGSRFLHSCFIVTWLTTEYSLLRCGVFTACSCTALSSILWPSPLLPR